MLGHPALGDERLLRHVEAEEVEAVVDRLDLAHLGEPELQAARPRRYQPGWKWNIMHPVLKFERTILAYLQIQILYKRTCGDAPQSGRGWC